MAKIIIPWILAVLFLATTAGAGYYAWQYKQDLDKKTSISDSQKDSGSEAKTCECNGQALYSTGTNFNYSVCYPLTWWPAEVPPADIGEGSYTSSVIFTNDQDNDPVNITIYNSSSISFENLRTQTGRGDENVDYLNETTKTINGETFTQLNFRNKSSNNEFAFLLIEKNDKIYFLTNFYPTPKGDIQTISNEILESFKFLDFSED